MIDYIGSALLVVFIVTVLVMLKRRERRDQQSDQLTQNSVSPGRLSFGQGGGS